MPNFTASATRLRKGKRMSRLIRNHGLVGGHLLWKKPTTVPDRLPPPVADLVQRGFSGGALDEK
jgi:hypothetical protein